MNWPYENVTHESGLKYQTFYIASIKETQISQTE